MALERPTLNQIQLRVEKDMETRVTNRVALLTQAVLRILARVFAGAMHILYGYLDQISRQLFVDQAETQYLDRHGTIWGITRKAAAFATGTCRFSGTNGTNVPTGTGIITDDGVEFETTAGGTITGGYVDLAIQAAEAGEDGNLDAATEMQLVSPITGVDSLALQGDTTGGEDEEEDADYRERILARIQEPPQGGAAHDYVAWQKEVEGVKNAWVFPQSRGAGTVGLYITATGPDPVPSSTLKDDVKDYVDDRKPVTVTTYMEGLEAGQKKTVDFDIKIDPNTTAIQNQIDLNMTNHFDEIAAPGETLLISQIRDAIFSSGVDNYEITNIDVAGSPVSIDDIVFTGFDYPVFGTITYSSF
jgi:uncharacterized phage protein gp47/JayE